MSYFSFLKDRNTGAAACMDFPHFKVHAGEHFMYTAANLTNIRLEWYEHTNET